jgi:hypothetical protein
MQRKYADVLGRRLHLGVWRRRRHMRQRLLLQRRDLWGE